MAYADTRAIQFVARRLRRQAVQLCLTFLLLAGRPDCQGHDVEELSG